MYEGLQSAETHGCMVEMGVICRIWAAHTPTKLGNGKN